MKKEHSITIIIINIFKAFDAADHDLFIQTLCNAGFHSIIHRWFNNYLSIRF